MPDGRSVEYAVWKACERVGIRPPSVKEQWEENDVTTQSLIIAYSQIREDEDAKIQSQCILASVR